MCWKEAEGQSEEKQIRVEASVNNGLGFGVTHRLLCKRTEMVTKKAKRLGESKHLTKVN